MGKKNNKFDRYERQDLSGMLDKPTGGKKPFKGNRNNIRKERPAPVVSKIASGICNLFAQQVVNYCDFLNGDVDQDTYLDQKKELEQLHRKERQLWSQFLGRFGIMLRLCFRGSLSVDAQGPKKESVGREGTTRRVTRNRDKDSGSSTCIVFV